MNAADLTVVCPTRNPEKADLLYRSFERHRPASREFVITRLTFAVDQDDPADYSVPHRRYDTHSAVDAMNAGALYFASRTRYLGYMGDDMEILTPDWDRRVVELLDRMDGGLAFVNDLTFNRWPMCTTIFMNAPIVTALGWMALPVVRELYFDDAWMALGRQMGKIHYLPDVLIRHHGHTDHPKALERERVSYWNWRDTQLLHDAAKALAALKEN